MKKHLIVFAVSAAAVFLGSCASSKETSVTRFPAPAETPRPTETEPENAPSPYATFGYLIQNENCKCPEFSSSDRTYPVSYRFEASYRMQEGFFTSIRIRIDNRSADTLFLDPGAVMVSSKNIDYQYNNKFIPLPDMVIPPGDSEDLNLDGKEVTTSPTWRKIAGEQLTLTLKGLRLGEKILGTQAITFVPENPLLKEPD
ncbi:MAG TPA: hypothetical protein VI932_05715 [Bacteroidota bacterium]|nr:hypothetical protein [Bacteroidota bacterium]